MQSAKNNASNLQTTINNAQTGDTVQIPSGRYFICQPTPIENAPDSFGVMKIPLVKSVQGVTTVNTYSGWVGVQFTVGASSLTVTSLGRWVVNGNSGNHTVKIMDAANNELASVTVNTANGLPDTFAYTALANNLTLLAYNTYSILSYETSGGDAWLNNETNNLAMHNVAGNLVHKGSSPFSPVNLKYKGSASSAVHNYAAWVNKNDITILGQGTNLTTLVAYNRDTTILFFGSSGTGWPSYSQAVTNILVRDIRFEGNPTVDYNGVTNSMGIIEEDQSTLAFSNIGSLVTFGGLPAPNGTISYSKNIVVSNCLFSNPSSIGIWLGYAKDVLITNCSFIYFNNISANMAKTLKGWCGILSQSLPVEDVSILNCSFNGNASSTNSSDYATDGMVWLSHGGKWIVENSTINNYGFEAIQFNAGPYTVVGNTFNTANRLSTCALNTYSDSTNLSLVTSNSCYSVYCFVNNSVTGGYAGVLGPTPSVIYYGRSPYNLVMSANIYNMPASIMSVNNGTTNWNPTACMQMSYINFATATGNTVANAGFAVAYNNYDTNPSFSTNFTIKVLCNDFANVKCASFLLQDGPNRMRQAEFTANKLGGTDFAAHLNLGIPINPPIMPTIILKGNQFWCNGTSPFATSVTTNAWIYNNQSGWFGLKFKVGANAIMANNLGRWVLSGNATPHVIKLVYAATGNDVPGGSTTITTAGQTAGGFTYAEMTNHIILSPNTSYYLVSWEAQGGDYWSSPCTVMTNATSGATVESAVYKIGNNPYDASLLGNYCYGAVNFTSCKLLNPVGTNWTAIAGSDLGTNCTGQYKNNSPSQFSNNMFSLY